ncbi:MAG TPA: YggS family pyridoxal phosphate-dependent enzyme [Kofleriaceae bacterium]|nr:YggS family pyridoxal phosphate-dependent enzyme [Kofleriaceae bacterium]
MARLLPRRRAMTLSLSERWGQIQVRAATAALRAGVDPAAVTVVAVSKGQPAAAVEEAIAAGVRDLGENYAQELAAKQLEVRGAVRARWHFIGKLQRNKVKQVVGRSALIHAVDSADLAAEIDRRARAAGVLQPILVAVNVGGEEQKSGVSPVAVDELLDAVAALPALRCEGLMTMPPLEEQAEANRPRFAALRTLRDRLAQPDRPLRQLSMGTTADFEIAIEEGATLVRVGTAIFGPRSV